MDLEDYYREWQNGRHEVVKKQELADIIAKINPVDLWEIIDSEKIEFIFSAAIWHDVDARNFMLNTSCIIHPEDYIKVLFSIIRNNPANPPLIARCLMGLKFIDDSILRSMMPNHNDFSPTIRTAIRIISNGHPIRAIHLYAYTCTEDEGKKIVEMLNSFSEMPVETEKV